MNLKKLYACYLLIQLVCAGTPAIAQQRVKNNGSKKVESNNLQYIDPRIGGVGILLEPTRPTVQLPHQVVRMYPERANYLDDQIESFPLTIVSHRSGEAFSVKPYAGPITADGWNKKLTYDHELEVTRPWYYAAFLPEEDMQIEFAPGKKTGIFRFNFPKNAPAKSILFNIYNDTGYYHFINDRVITGVENYTGKVKVFMYGEFNKPVRHSFLNNNATFADTLKANWQKKAWVTLPSNTYSIEFRYAVSFISAQQAKANFESEIRSNAFSAIKQRAKDAWRQVVAQIKVQGGTVAQRRSFYTALYRCNERMVDISEGNRYYSGYDNHVHNTNAPFYVDDWVWDTYLAQHPLQAILNPAMERDIVNSYVTMYQQSGWLPTFPLVDGDSHRMNGFHSSVMILDDYRKGIKADHPAVALQAMLKNGTKATMLPWENGPKTVLDDFYYQKGYFPALKPNEKETVKQVNDFERRQAVAVTLGASYDDWAVGEMAKELGQLNEYEVFSKRANNYKNLWQSSTGMFMPKDQEGNWISINPKLDGGLGGRDYFDENNGCTYMWQVQHDIPGLIALNGGKEKFEARLDQLFRESLDDTKYGFWNKFPDATGLVGQFSMGNEPSFFIPYLYNYTTPWKTQKRIRFLLDVWYKDNIFGMPGDEDGGGMSAFVVFSSMGFYPICPGKPVYTIGSPLFSRIEIALTNGKRFCIVAKNCSVVNKYIQKARLNGKPINSPWFSHQQLMQGGRLQLVMGSKPNKTWGVEKSNQQLSSGAIY